MTYKTCPLCHAEKAIEEFDSYYCKSRQKRRYQGYCRDCQKPTANKRAKVYYAQNREERLIKAQQYRNDPDNRDKLQSQRKRFKVLYIQELKDCYVRSVIGITSADEKLIPGIVEVARLKIKLSRKIKSIRDAKK